MRKLFLDDIREPIGAFHLVPNESKHLYLEDNWILVRSYLEFVEYIKNNDFPDLISFDHDLSTDHYQIDFDDWESFSSEQLGVEETGLDCAKWLVNYCEENNLKLPEFVVHSQNPVGRKNIDMYLKNAIKHLNL